jgi:hypothetical protein
MNGSTPASFSKKKIGNAWFVAMHCGIDFLRLLPWFQVFIEVVVALVS